MSDEFFVSKITGQSFTREEILLGCNNRIIAIKNLRAFTGKGLKESKDEIETLEQDPNNYIREWAILKCFKKYSTQSEPNPALTKEEFLQILSDAIDAGSKLYFSDPVEIVIQTCQNIKIQGGLPAIAKQIQQCIDNL